MTDIQNQNTSPSHRTRPPTDEVAEGMAVKRVFDLRRGSAPMYFEATVSDPPDPVDVDVKEDAVAAAIIRGRQAVADFVRRRGSAVEPMPLVSREFDVTDNLSDDEEAGIYRDAIADILQAGNFARWDATDLCRAALATQRAQKAAGVSAARVRAANQEPQVAPDADETPLETS